MSIVDQLFSHLDQFSSPPYLFVGSGIARRYFNLPDWRGLLKGMCEEHGLNHGLLSSSVNGDLPKLASEMAAQFNEKWWSEELYKESRAKFASDAVTKEDALKIEIAAYLERSISSATGEDIGREIELFQKVVVEGIVTTNWDGLLEHLFPTYEVYVGQEALLFSHIQGIGEIYKIHGSVEQPRSLVVTSDDYSTFERKNPYLASKLLTFFVEHPIVFIGYSLTDKNILSILNSILSCLSPSNVKKLSDRLVFVQWDPACTKDRIERTILSVEGQNLLVMQVTVGSMHGVYEALGKIKRQLPAKLLRMLKEQVYQLVHTASPSEKLLVQDIDAATDFHDVEFAVGVGIQERLRDKGYTAISRIDLMRDLLQNDGGFNAKLIVSQTLPQLLKHSPYIPVFKYLALASASADFDLSKLPAKVQDAAACTYAHFVPTSTSKGFAAAVEKWDKGFKAFAAKNPVNTVLGYAGKLPQDQMDVNDLHEFLVNNIGQLTATSTNYCKLVCILDYLKYAHTVIGQPPKSRRRAKVTPAMDIK
jgi:hypothetical protein